MPELSRFLGIVICTTAIIRLRIFTQSMAILKLRSKSNPARSTGSFHDARSTLC